MKKSPLLLAILLRSFTVALGFAATTPSSAAEGALMQFAALSAIAEDVPRWQLHDFSFTAKAPAPNPFMVPFSATVKGPGGVELKVPGFFDGDGTWKIRVAPTVEGAWSLVTKSDVKELDGKTAEFTCVKNTNPNLHGLLRVDQAHPHHFIFEDGTRFFFQGYEYDWLCARRGQARSADGEAVARSHREARLQLRHPQLLRAPFGGQQDKEAGEKAKARDSSP